MSLQFGSIPIAAGAGLSPMAGVTEAALRRLCVQHGAVYTVSEMVSAKALTMGDKKSLALLRGKTEGAPYGVQLFGQQPEVLAEAIHAIEGEDFDYIDINMGCPAPKIVGHGAGSGLLRTPALAGEMAEAAVKASKRPVTVKLRIGWDENCMTGLEVAQRCEAAGVSALVVHARTRAQQYQPGVNQGAVAAIKAAVQIPVVYNGDVTDGRSALAALQATGCDGIAVGRGAMGNPWVFSEIRAAMLGEAPPQQPGLQERFAALKTQVEALVEDRGEVNGMCAARGVAGHYMKGLKGAASLRRQAYGMETFADLLALIDDAWEYQRAAGALAEAEGM